jgi:hypothetical protein
MVPLLGALLDYDATPEAYERYDRMTALELFQKCAPLKLLSDALSTLLATVLHVFMRPCSWQDV